MASYGTRTGIDDDCRAPRMIPPVMRAIREAIEAFEASVQLKHMLGSTLYEDVCDPARLRSPALLDVGGH
jgi:hypothetical protein